MDIKNILDACVDEMYGMEKGAFIARPDEAIPIGDGMLTRRQIKHIIEQRKAERKSAEEIKTVLALIPEAIVNPDFEVMNWNRAYRESIVRAKIFYETDRGVIVVMDRELRGKRNVITGYLCSPKRVSRIENKMLHTTAAGKTPDSRDVPKSNPSIKHYPYG